MYISYDLQNDKSEKNLETSPISEDSDKLEILEQLVSSFYDILTSTKIVDDESEDYSTEKNNDDDVKKIEKESVMNDSSVFKANNEKEDQIVDMLNTLKEEKEETFAINKVKSDQEKHTDDCNARDDTRKVETKNNNFPFYFYLFLLVLALFRAFKM